MMSDILRLDVLLHGQTVGTLTNAGADRSIFAWNEAYLNDETRATLGLGFKDTFGNLMTDFRPYQTRLMPFFSNLLPEGHLRQYLCAKLDINPVREFGLLMALGQDLPGAVSVQPSSDRDLVPTREAPSNNAFEDEPDELLRFSLAGVQLKFSAIGHPNGGLTIPAHGIGGNWIVKLPSSQFDAVPENEFSMMQLAKLIGINVPAIDLVPVSEIGQLPSGLARAGQQALVIERFDRRADGSPVHIEDFAQVYGVYSEDKYKKASLRNIASVLAAECSFSDLEEFVRRIVFNVLIGNGDMHLKNWSLIYHDRRTPALAPAYDFVSTVPYLPGETMALNVSRTKRFDEIDLREFEHFANKSGMPTTLVTDTVRRTVSEFHDTWHAEQANLPMSSTVRQAINAHLKDLPIAQLR